MFWIDQGASQARVIARTPHRCAAGEIEVALKSVFTDRTSWQKMLKNELLDVEKLVDTAENRLYKVYGYVDQARRHLLPALATS